jgi:hypothetical protein
MQQKVNDLKRMSQSVEDLRAARTESVSSTGTLITASNGLFPDTPKRPHAFSKMVLKTGFLFKLVDKGIKTWNLMYFELDSYMFSYYKNRGVVKIPPPILTF